MPKFKGFPAGKVHQVPIPAPFFHEILPEIDHLGELKTTLYIFWRLERMEGSFRLLNLADITSDTAFMAGLAGSTEESQAVLLQSLERAEARGTLLMATFDLEGREAKLIFLNSPKGRAALRAIASGQWRPEATHPQLPPEVNEPPNIFRLYEENIGVLTPMIADALTDAERTYPLPWIEEAIEIAVKQNKRNWRYIEAILERWQREGKHGRKEKPEDRSDTQEDRRRYVEGEFADFIQH